MFNCTILKLWSGFLRKDLLQRYIIRNCQSQNNAAILPYQRWHTFSPCMQDNYLACSYNLSCIQGVEVIIIFGSVHLWHSWCYTNLHSHVRFSSPKPKAQVSFSDQNLSIVCCRRCSCRKLFIFSSSSPEPLG